MPDTSRRRTTRVPPTLWHLRERGGCAHARAGSSCGTVHYAARIIPMCTETNWTATRDREWCARKEGNDKATAWAERLVEGDYKQHGVRVSNSRDASKSGFKLIFAGNTLLLSFFLSSPLCVHRMLPVFFFFLRIEISVPLRFSSSRDTIHWHLSSRSTRK